MKNIVKMFRELLGTKKINQQKSQDELHIEKRTAVDDRNALPLKRIRTVTYQNTEILIVDYSDSKESEMIDIGTNARDFIIKENKKVLLLNILNEKNYATPKFVRHTEIMQKDIEPLVDKQAVTGINKIKVMILRGLNLGLKKSIQHFDTVEEAFKFLVNENASEN